MILIRGIKGEQYARKIENGIVDCRDILSAVLQPPVTGYEYSDYYEKNLVKALSYTWYGLNPSLHDPDFLYSLMIDYYVPHIYLTYFHILNENSLEWLEKFDNDHFFIAVNVKLDKITKTAIGNEYFGSQMLYVDSISEINQEENHLFRAACMCSIEDLFTNKKDMSLSLQIYNTLAFALLCRERDEKFNDIENEFRIIAYDCPRVESGKITQLPREATITVKNGGQYSGKLVAREDTIFKSNLYVLNVLNRHLKDVLVEANGEITIDSRFKSIDLNTISDDYGYIGGKKECAYFIKKMMKYKDDNIYVKRTVRRKYKIDSLKNAKFAPGFRKVEY